MFDDMWGSIPRQALKFGVLHITTPRCINTTDDRENGRAERGLSPISVEPPPKSTNLPRYLSSVQPDAFWLGNTEARKTRRKQTVTTKGATTSELYYQDLQTWISPHGPHVRHAIVILGSTTLRRGHTYCWNRGAIRLKR